MGRDLPVRAERFLSALSRDLSALSSAERDTVLLELRGHLSERAAQGEAALDAALGALGDPADLAGAFDQGPGAGIAPVPRVFSTPWRRMRVGEVVGEVRATLLASRNGLMMVGLVVMSALTATNFLIWSYFGAQGVGPEGLAMMVAQWLTIMLAACAGYRIILSNEPRPWRIAPSTFRFAVASLVVDLLIGVPAFALDGAIKGTHSPAATESTEAFVVRFVAMAAVTSIGFCLTLRIQPWLVALAIGRRGLSLAASWRGTAGRMLNILRGWVVLVLPLFLIHMGLNRLAYELAPGGIGMFALAWLEGIAATCVTIGVILLNATIFRWATGEPIPSARPFATEPPDPAIVEECRARLVVRLPPPTQEGDEPGGDPPRRRIRRSGAGFGLLRLTGARRP